MSGPGGKQADSLKVLTPTRLSESTEPKGKKTRGESPRPTLLGMLVAGACNVLKLPTRHFEFSLAEAAA